MTIGTHKTAIYADSDGSLCVKYHATVIARRDAHGMITLNSGGWRTATTKKRINQALAQWGTHFYIYQKDYDWFVAKRHCEGDEEICDFLDGMTLQSGTAQ